MDPAIGVICMDTIFEKIPGHIRNPSTFDFPLLYHVVEGATADRVVTRADPTLLEPFIAAARSLQARGAAAITSGCGFLAMFQRELAAAVDVPVFSSSLIQLPMVHRMLRPDQAVGLLVAKKVSLTARHLEPVGAADVPLRVAGLENQPEFREVILEGRRASLDAARLEREVLEEVDQLCIDHPDIGVVVIECTDLAPFASAIQRRTGHAVFDIVTLTTMVHHAVAQRPWR